MWVMLEASDDEWEVGYYDPATNMFEGIYVGLTKDEAARWVNYLNGGTGALFTGGGIRFA